MLFLTQTRVFYTSDVHGSEKCFRKFLGAAAFYKCKIIILGGDITGKMIVFAVVRPDGTYDVDWPIPRVLNSKTELAEFESVVKSSGRYLHLTSQEEIQKLRTDTRLADELIMKLTIMRLEEWVATAENYFKTHKDIQCFVMPGNDDAYEIDKVLEGHEPYVINPDEKLIALPEQYELISLGKSNITPWNCPRDLPEEEVARKIEALVSNVDDVGKSIFNFHCPPYDTNLDLAPKLDENFRPQRGLGGIATIHAGSTAIRTAVERYQPLLGLHGHIHESKGVSQIGRTLTLNPGSEYAEGILRGAIVVLENGKIKTHMFSGG